MGLHLRGVVVATYVSDEDVYPTDAAYSRVVGVYCDVLVYSSMEGLREGLIRRALVVQPSVGMHEGRIWKPRAARQDLAQGEIKEDSNPRDLDGDHVLVGFMDNSYTQPVVLAGVPHPRTGQGNDELPEAGHRQRLVLDDGEPAFWKHRGTFFGTDGEGNIVCDTTRAHGGEYTGEGDEAPAEDAAHGNVVYRVNNRGSFTIEGVDKDAGDRKFQIVFADDALTLRLDDADSHIVVEDGQITLRVGGDESKHVAVVEPLETLYGADKAVFDAHVHLDTALRTMLGVLAGDFTALGMAVGIGAASAAAITTYTGLAPPAAPEPPTLPAPDWDPSINSTKVVIPSL
jgi:hypothetical protein